MLRLLPTTPDRSTCLLTCYSLARYPISQSATRSVRRVNGNRQDHHRSVEWAGGLAVVYAVRRVWRTQAKAGHLLLSALSAPGPTTDAQHRPPWLALDA